MSPLPALMTGPGRSQIRAAPSAALVASEPPARKTTAVTGPGWGNEAVFAWLVRSQIRTWPSELAAARSRPPGAKATELTQPFGRSAGGRAP